LGPQGDPQDTLPHESFTGKSLRALERALSGEATTVPIDWVFSRLCEEFGCLPNEAPDLPFGLCTRIMQLRDYAQTRALIESSSAEDLKKKMTPSIENVLRIQAEIDIASREEA